MMASGSVMWLAYCPSLPLDSVRSVQVSDSLSSVFSAVEGSLAYGTAMSQHTKVAGAVSAALSPGYTSAGPVVTVPLIFVKILCGLMGTSEKSFGRKAGP